MPDILIPHANAERRAAAHLIDDGVYVLSLCKLHTPHANETRFPDTRENRIRVQQASRHICGLCLNILRRRARTAQTVSREDERKTPPKQPTRGQLEAEMWQRFTGLPLSIQSKGKG